MTVRRIVAVTALILVGFVVLLASRDAQRNEPSRAIVGEVAPNVAGTSWDGRTFSLDDELAEQRWVVVNFFGSWCPPCVREHPELIEFSERHADDDLTLVAVAIGEGQAAVEAFFTERGGSWPVIVDEEANARTIVEYGVTAPPTTVVITPGGIVADVVFGEVTADLLDQILAQAGFQ